MKKNNIAKSLILLLVAGITIASCRSGESKKDGASANDSLHAEGKVKTVELQKLAAEAFSSYVDIQGKVDADENVSLNAQIPGTVEKINVKLGDVVSAGAVLAELDGKVIKSGIEELQSALDFAKTMYEKQKNLWDQKIGTEMQYLQAKTQKESLEKKLASLNDQLSNTKIITPISGTIDAVDIKLGQATAPGVPAIRVINMNSLKVKGEVGESYISKVKTANKVVIVLPDLHDTIHTVISYASKVISPLNRTFTITANLPAGKNYYPNQVAIIKIIDYTNLKAIVVPVNTIQESEDGKYVFVAVNGNAKKVKIKAGKQYNGFTEVTDGLKGGEQLIVKGFQDLNDGDNIKF